MKSIFFSRTYHSIFIHVQCALRRHHSVASSLGTIQILRKHYFGGFSNPPAVYVLFACKNDQFLNHTPSYAYVICIYEWSLIKVKNSVNSLSSRIEEVLSLILFLFGNEKKKYVTYPMDSLIEKIVHA